MEGWTCPVCKRGLNPNEKFCAHGALGAPYIGYPQPNTTFPPQTGDPLPPQPNTTCGGFTTDDQIYN